LKSIIRQFALLVFILIQAGCAGVPTRADLPTEATPYTVFLIQDRWHTALLVEGPALLAHSTKLGRDFHDHKYLLVGWGDGAYFVEDHPGWSEAVKALVASDFPALQVGGRETNPPFGMQPEADIPLAITERGLQKLAAYIDRSIAADAQGRPIYLGRQDANLNLFYQATGSYGLFNNCNSWVVNALQAAELPISGFNLTAQSVIDQAARISRLQQQEL